MTACTKNNLSAISALTFRPLSVDIAFEGITHTVAVKQKHQPDKFIINNASGQFEHGRLHAIMGPSGCGKSSLLNVLAGFNPVAKGDMYFNGTYCSIDKWSQLITPARSYILQDDFLVAELTVLEQLVYSVDLKVPYETPAKTRQQIVETLLERTGLKECANRAIGVLSGGQRKRLCVASELVNYPPVLFLDEPTTGLDSASCYRVIELLKTVAQCGCNVIATIHQPNSRVFAIFDTLTVLGNGGVVAFNGPAIALAESMNHLLRVNVPRIDNPAEFLFEGKNIEKMAKIRSDYKRMIVTEVSEMIKQRGDLAEIKRSWARLEGDDGYLADERDAAKSKKSSAADYLGTSDLEVEPYFPAANSANVKLLCQNSLPAPDKRFRILFKRTMMQSGRDKVFMMGRILAYILTSALTGLVFQLVGADAALALSNVAFLYIITNIFMMGTSIVTVMNSQHYLNVLIREDINNWYGVSAFYLCRSAIEAVVTVIIACLFSAMMWLMTSQQQEIVPGLLTVALIICLHCLATHHFCFILAMFTDEASLAQLPFALVMLHVIFCGYFVPLPNLPVWIFWMRYVHFPSFSFVAVMKAAYGTLFSKLPIAIPCKLSGHPMCQRFTKGADILEIWKIDMNEPIWNDIIALACYTVVYAALGWALIVVYLRNSKRSIARL